MDSQVARPPRALAASLAALLATAIVGVATRGAGAASTSTSPSPTSSTSTSTSSTTAAPANGTQPIRRTIWGQTDALNAPGQTLYLQQVVIDPGAKLPEHFHQGTQVATVRAGVLTYHVVDGTASVTRANGTTEQVTGPATVRLRRGDGLVEPQPDSTDASFAATLGVIGGTGSYLHVTGSGVFNGTRRAALGGQVDSTFDLDLGGVQ